MTCVRETSFYYIVMMTSSLNAPSLKVDLETLKMLHLLTKKDKGADTNVLQKLIHNIKLKCFYLTFKDKYTLIGT